MAVDRVESARFPYLPITVNLGTWTDTVIASVDTGFDGYLALPPNRLPTGLTSDLILGWSLADGTWIDSPGYLCRIQVGNLASFEGWIIALGHEPLVGRGVIDHFRVVLDHGRRIIVEP